VVESHRDEEEDDKERRSGGKGKEEECDWGQQASRSAEQSARPGEEKE
jgi:hypothetical protein